MNGNPPKPGRVFANTAWIFPTRSLFSDDYALTIPDDDPSEERFVTIGMDALGRILVVVYTWRGRRIRVISARKADSYERKQYEEQL